MADYKRESSTASYDPSLSDTTFDSILDVDSYNSSHRRLAFYVTTLEEDEEGVAIAAIFRAIYDGDDHGTFLAKLEERILQHDRKIEKMCNSHYQLFIDSIQELLQVKSRAEKLRNEVTETNDALELSTRQVLQRAGDLVKYRQVLCNISATIEALGIALPVLEMYAKLDEQMKAGRYYPALKTIELLEHTYLPRVASHRFAHAMTSRIPRLRQQVKEASMNDLTDFLENIRTYSAKIGEVAMRQASDDSSGVGGVVQHGPVALRRKKKRKAPAPPNPFSGEIESGDQNNQVNGSGGLDSNSSSSAVSSPEDETSAQDLVDFSPVYKCYHIYSVLGIREDFESYYRQQRQQQAKLALQLPPNPKNSIDTYHHYFAEIVGFFVVEEQIVHGAQGLVTREHLDDVWAQAADLITTAVRNNTAFCTDATDMLKIKRLIQLFAKTLSGYGYKVEALHKLLMELQEHYNEILMSACVRTFRDAFDRDTYHPMEVQTPADFQRILDDFPFRDDLLEKAPFPKKFPFSQFVPAIFVELKTFISECVKFSEDLNLSATEVEDIVRKSTNLLLTRTLSGCLTTLIKKPTLGLLQLIQITINTNYLEDASVYLEDYISCVFRSSNNRHVAKLQGKSIFKDARKDAEAQIYEQIKKKIDESIELARYDWGLVEAKGQASSYMMDLIAFLNNVFQAFTNLPVRHAVAEYKDNVAQTACMTACQHLAARLMDVIMSDEVKFISPGAISQFNLDLIQCELFASSEPVQGFKEGALQMFFAELRQLLDLFMDDDWTTYINDYGKDNAKYLRVSASTALAMLEKVREAERRKTIFASLKPRDRDKKRLQENVVKQLKVLAQSSSNGLLSPQAI